MQRLTVDAGESEPPSNSPGHVMPPRHGVHGLRAASTQTLSMQDPDAQLPSVSQLNVRRTHVGMPPTFSQQPICASAIQGRLHPKSTIKLKAKRGEKVMTP
jgi:hypothetical protein